MLNDITKSLKCVFALPFVLLFCSCMNNGSNHDTTNNMELMASSWHFDSEPSCIEIIDEGKVVVVGSENGSFYIKSGDAIGEVNVGLGSRVMKIQYLGARNNTYYYLVSIRRKGLQVVAVSSEYHVISRKTILMEKDGLPDKGDRYTAFDWQEDPNGEYGLYVGTSNGVWHLNLQLSDIPSASQSQLQMTRVGSLGRNIARYPIQALSFWKGALYIAAQDGVWRMKRGETFKRVTKNTGKYNSLFVIGDRLVSLMGQEMVYIDSLGKVSAEPNPNHFSYMVQINDTTVYGFDRNRIFVNGQLSSYGLGDIKTSQNTVGIIHDADGNVSALMMLRGSDLVRMNVQLTPQREPLGVMALTSDTTNHCIYMIDENRDLFCLTDQNVSKKGHLEDMTAYIVDMMYVNGQLWLLSQYTLYKANTESGIFSDNIDVEKIDIFKYLPNDQRQTERLVCFSTVDDNNIIIGSQTHIWNYNIDKDISSQNPKKMHVKASVDAKDNAIDLDSLMEPVLAQSIDVFSDAHFPTVLVGTTDWGLLSLDSSHRNTLSQSSWNSADGSMLNNIRSICHGYTSDSHDTIKVAVATNDKICLFTSYADKDVSVGRANAVVKKLEYLDSKHILAIGNYGGLQLYDVSSDSLRLERTYFDNTFFDQKIASLPDNILLITSGGPYQFNKKTMQLRPLDTMPRTVSWKDYIFQILLILLSIGCIAFILKELFQIWQKRNKRRQLMKQRQDHHDLIVSIYSSIPLSYKGVTTDGQQPSESAMVDEIMNTLHSVQFETQYFQSSLDVYRRLVEKERKLGRVNTTTWEKLMKEWSNQIPADRAKQFISEVNGVLRHHMQADWADCIFSAELKESCAQWILNVPQLPDQQNLSDDAYITANGDSLKKILKIYFGEEQQEGSRKEIVARYIGYKKQVEDSLLVAYRRIVGMSSQNEEFRSQLIDYFKNLLTFLYYQLFVDKSNHLLNYSEKEHRFIPYYDFQQTILVLSSFVGADEDFRPRTLTDHLYLEAEGNLSSENPISKFKDKTKTLHQAFYKHPQDDMNYDHWIQLLFETYEPFKQMYGQSPKK